VNGLKLKYDERLSNFALEIHFRRFKEEGDDDDDGTSGGDTEGGDAAVAAAEAAWEASEARRTTRRAARYAEANIDAKVAKKQKNQTERDPQLDLRRIRSMNLDGRA
jgi:hypothetical protein